MRILLLGFLLIMSSAVIAQTPTIESGVPLELAKWRAAHYSDVRYKLNLTLEKMSPVLKGTIEIRVKVGARTLLSASSQGGEIPPIILDWRKVKDHEEKSTITNVTINGKAAEFSRHSPRADKSVRAPFEEHNEHLIFRDGVVFGENVIKLDFTSPILTSGSAITRYIDKEDGTEYIYSLFVPSDASTAFPVFDQPDLKARFTLTMTVPSSWKLVSNTAYPGSDATGYKKWMSQDVVGAINAPGEWITTTTFAETKPISTYVFAFAAGPFEKFTDAGIGSNPSGNERAPLRSGIPTGTLPTGRVTASAPEGSIYVRRSQAAKFKPHAAEVFRLNREAVKFFEQYFDYKFPWPKYDLVLIPEFPFGGMEHAGATFLRESSIIFPQEPTKNDHISRATLIFHETAHQWFGDTVTMRWFDDLWLKEGFATFMAYKALEKIMPEMNAWKVFYERVKQAAYQTDSTRGTTAIYQPIANLSAAKSAYGAIVYNKAPAFLRQAEFYLESDKFQTAVRAFLKKHEFANGAWQDLVKEFEASSGRDLNVWARQWVTFPGVGVVSSFIPSELCWMQKKDRNSGNVWDIRTQALLRFEDGSEKVEEEIRRPTSRIGFECTPVRSTTDKRIVFGLPNYGDYGYGIFLLDEKSRDYVLKNIQYEKDPFLRTMMWGALWDSVREGELDPRVFVELVVKVLQNPAREQGRNKGDDSNALTNVRASATEDESTTALLLNRVGTAMNYYMSEPPALAGGQKLGPGPTDGPAANAARTDLRSRVEDMLIERMRDAPTLGQRITFYRAFLSIASSEKARGVLKDLLAAGGNPSGSEGAPKRSGAPKGTLPTGRVTAIAIPIKTKDRFDIVTRLLILNDPDAPKLLADLEKTEKSDDAKRWAYAAKAGIPTAENKAKYWNDFINDKTMSESWIEAAFGPFNSIRHSDLTLPYLQKALRELPNHKRSRKIFFVNGWLGAFVGGQRSQEALDIIDKFIADNPNLDKDLRLKILENADIIERAVKIRAKFGR